MIAVAAASELLDGNWHLTDKSFACGQLVCWESQINFKSFHLVHETNVL